MNDNMIREILCAYLDARHEKVRIFDEMRAGRARADIVAVTDKLTGYEIKSDLDSYARLPVQVREYSRHFEENYAVVGKSHRTGVLERVPEYWGVICVSEAGAEVLRTASRAPKFSWTMHLNILWLSELRAILGANGLPKLSGQRKTALKRSIIKNVREETLRRCVCDELFERDYARRSGS